MSVLERCPSYRELNKGSKERQGPTLSVRFTKVSVKRESTVYSLLLRNKSNENYSPIECSSLIINDNGKQTCFRLSPIQRHSLGC